MEKTEDVDALTHAIHRVMSGSIYLNDINANVATAGSDNQSDQQLIKTLSDRELRTLQYLVSGLSNKKISETMLLSEKTVSTYKTRVLNKLNIKSVVYLAEFAKRNNLVE